ncbi:hypothetical protein [Candidatus Enterococcus courvalinii]|uniref:Uncharacterized protein n=1 Tax=Candidatus Enterococcus courvalinii TaxID=2815329 RepID=A0ABS3HY09_9ENTE|nr:hypothetical protein [Enterococcus sp. MSG2901]MBO0480807.1 hypothetical protein [Enterococcus sp. MSG2901]
MKKRKFLTFTLTSLLFIGSFTPACTNVVQAMELSQEINQTEKLESLNSTINNIKTSTNNLNFNEQRILDTYTEELSNEYIETLKSGSSKQNNTEFTLNQRGVGSLMAHLLLRYTKTYILKTLPKLLYKKVAGVIGGSVSEATFVNIWSNIIGIATLSNIGSLVSSGLNSIGITGWLSDAIGNAVQIAIDVFL